MRFLSLALVLLAAPFVNAQQYCPPGTYCPLPTSGTVYQLPPQQVDQLVLQADMQLQTMVETSQDSGPSSAAAVRVSTGGGCGSGSVCGYYKEGSLVLTNAHVVGTRVGRQVTIRAVVDGQTKDMSGTVIMAAYSDRTLTDWAIVYVEGLDEIEPVNLSKERPTGTHYTRGSPRCVWPLRDSSVITADIADNSPLWRWRPNSIGGQSGSGVWSSVNDLQYGLLTWSWGGLGAGQQTSEIYRQARERSVKGAPRIAGLVPVSEMASSDVIVENGFYAQSGIDELPIWADAGDSGPGGGAGGIGDGDDDCDCGTEDERRLFGRLRDRSRERGVDFLQLLNLILQILELFRSA